MVYTFQSRLRHLGDRMKELASEEVEIFRGSNSTKCVKAVPIIKTMDEESPNESPFITRIETQLWVFDRVDYKFEGIAALPEKDDLIERGDKEVFKIVAIGEANSPYEFTTSSRDRFVVTSVQTTEKT